MSLAKILAPRICELGKIKIGGLGEERKSRSGATYRVPIKYDSFHITTLGRDAEGMLIEDTALMDDLPKDPDGKLRSLPVSLLSHDIEEVMQAGYMWYNGKRLAGKSDGETLTVYFDHRAGKWLDKPKVVPWSEEYASLEINGTPVFKLHCTLNVMIASAVARFGGLYKFRTTSRITSDQLYGSLVQLRRLTGGVLRGLPLRLVVRPMQVQPNGQLTTIYVVHVELQGADIAAIQARALELAQFEVQHVKQLAATQAEYRALLAAPDEFADEAEEAEIAKEFHPHQQDGQPGRLPEKTHSPPLSPPTDPMMSAADAEKLLLHAQNLDELKAVWSTIYSLWRTFSEAEREHLIAVKEQRKYELSRAPEGEHRSDPSRAPTNSPDAGNTSAQTVGPSVPLNVNVAPSITPTAQTENVPSAAPSNASVGNGQETVATDPLPMPAAEHRTEPPRETTGDRVGEILGLLGVLGISWTQIRDRAAGKATEIASALGLKDMTAKTRLADIPEPKQHELRTLLGTLVAEKRKNKAARAARRQEKEQEAGATS